MCSGVLATAHLCSVSIHMVFWQYAYSTCNVEFLLGVAGNFGSANPAVGIQPRSVLENASEEGAEGVAAGGFPVQGRRILPIWQLHH